jgi:hypothetical protein
VRAVVALDTNHLGFATQMCARTASNRASLTDQIASLVARLHPTVTLERRHDDRIAIPVLFRLTPLDSDRLPVTSLSAIVVGKNISRRGLSFFHENPIPHRRALIELTHPGIAPFAAEIDISWCRFTKPGWYESGGRLIRAVSDPDQLHDDSLPRFLLPKEVLTESSPLSAVNGECGI